MSLDRSIPCCDDFDASPPASPEETDQFHDGEPDQPETISPSPAKRRRLQENILDPRFDSIQKQVSELKAIILGSLKPTASFNLPATHDETNSITSEIIEPEVTFGWEPPETTLSESMKKSDESKVRYIKKLQHFGETEWSHVRFAEIQRKYLSTPAFTNLDLNDELLPFETKPFFNRSLDQTFGALTNMLIAQREAIQSSVKDLLSWSTDRKTRLTPASLNTKVQEIFSTDCKFKEISKDLLQVICGRRAGIIEQRREHVLSAVKDKYNRTALRRIPPTSSHLFEPKELSEAITKMGGCVRVLRRPYLPAEGRQASPKRSSNPAVTFRQPERPFTSARSQQAIPASGKGKSVVGKRPFALAKNKHFQGPRDQNRDQGKRQ